MRRKVAECILMISLLSGCGMATGSSEVLSSDVAASSSEESVVVSSTEEVQAGKTEQESSLVASGSGEDKQATIDTNSVDDQQQQQVPDSNGEGSSIVEGDGSAAEGSWDEDPVDTTGDDQQTGETQQPEVQTGALTDYTQCAYYKTSKGKEHIERIINQVFGNLSTYSEIPSQFILKPLNSAEMQQMFKDLIVKNDCKNGDEADNLKLQVLNTYVDNAGYLAYLQGGSSSSQQTPQQQQAVQQAQDSGLLQPIGGGDDSGSQGQGGSSDDPTGGVDEWGWDTYDWQVSDDGAFTGEDPAGGVDEWDWHDCGLGGEAQ